MAVSASVLPAPVAPPSVTDALSPFTAPATASFTAPFATPFTTPFTDYVADAWQRSVLFLDTLRERGNRTYLHEKAGMPPVLAFDYEVVLDARELDDPASYALLRILPAADAPTDPRMRPFVVIDPRAGHGPGIAGFKMDSEIGVALRKGHPCYLVTFFPMPCETQTIQSVARAEAAFLRRVRELHPDADGLPFVIGNCQGGWAAALLAASAPELVGPLMLAGSPLSYWAGVRGKNPMRYAGGLLGGTWAASFAADLGDGHFDGAYLVQNFENLDPANTLWGKLYGLYSKVDTERERFLAFERWWGGHFQLNRAEIDWILQNLFVGNRLTRNEVYANGARSPVDLRNIRTPIIVLASWGDNITPPQQALNWIPDLYSSVNEIVANEQVIVYCLHEKAGHLGIFVSSSVANREDTELFSALDLIDVLPPGLYEAIITDRKPEAARLDALEGRYEIRFERRTIDDVIALDDGRADEQPFEVARRYSAVNQRLYDLFVSPLVRASSNAYGAYLLRELQPSRIERGVLSDANPALAALSAVADDVRSHRKPVDADNPFAILEKQMSTAIESALDGYRNVRDAWFESLFFGIYGAPWAQALAGVDPDSAQHAAAPPLVELRKELAALRLNSAHENLAKGTPLDAFMRIVAYLADEMHTVQYRPFQKMRELAQQYLGDHQPSIAQLKEAARRQGFIVQLDPKAAIEALPQLVPDTPTRRALLVAVYRVFTSAAPLEGERRVRFREIERVLGVEPGSMKHELPSKEAPRLEAPAPAPQLAGPRSSDGTPARAGGNATNVANVTRGADAPVKPKVKVRATAAGGATSAAAKPHAAKPHAAETAKPEKAPRRVRAAAGTATRAAASPAARRRTSRTGGQ